MAAFDYDLVVIGGGAAGMVSSTLGAGLGGKVALVEHRELGGECTHYGCVPSKTLIRIANAYHRAVNAERSGCGPAVPEGGHGVDPARAMDRVREVVRRVYEGHRPEVFRERGMEIIIGKPAFLDNHHIDVDGRTISATSFIISTGSSALVPPIEGIHTVPFLTNESLFALKELPRSMIVLGGGPVGTELAQAMGRLGVDITIVEMGDRILVREDRELGDLIAQRLAHEGIRILTGTKAVRFSGDEDGISLAVEAAGGAKSVVRAEAVLVAVGRKANVEGLRLENAHVEYSPQGITTDDTLRTTQPNIYACGDVTGPYRFSHMAEYQARIAAQNALLPVRRHADYEHYIWCMFTDPELAHAGLTEDEARQRHEKVQVYRWEYKNTDRGRTDAEELGLSKIICSDRYRILGAHILGSRAGDVIHEVQTAKTLGVPFYKLDSIIHIYPTFSDVIKQPAKLCHIDELKGNPFLRLLGGRLTQKASPQKDG